MANTVRVAVIQASPIFLDLEGSLEKAESLVRLAATEGAKVVAFGETWLPGYPAWIDEAPGAAFWNHAPAKKAFARLHANSLVVGGPESGRLAELARSSGVVLCMGINERIEHGPGHGTIYNSFLIYDADGSLANHHRKLVPTYTERLIWGTGDGKGLRSVNTACGRVGGLICWEHWMPLARQAMHDTAEKIHVALWPTVHEVHQLASRHYAFEGRCFVLAAGSLTAAGDLPPGLEARADAAAGGADRLLLRGGAAVIAPDGRFLAGPVFDDETTLYSDLDLEEIPREMQTLDTTGHYFRPDVFQLSVDRSRPTET